MTNEIQDSPPAANEAMLMGDPTAPTFRGPPTAERIPRTGEITRPTPAVMAVVDSEGYLVPLQTPGDLLRAFKTIWRATETQE